MIEYDNRNASAREKIVFAKWEFEEIVGKDFGAVDVRLTDPLTDEEEADFKDGISGQNSDGLGEGFEQQGINIDGISEKSVEKFKKYDIINSTNQNWRRYFHEKNKNRYAGFNMEWFRYRHNFVLFHLFFLYWR